MQPTIPQVHLVICLDSRIAPGPVLQGLDAIRAKYWQQEVVCLCDTSWRPFLGNEAAVVCLDRESIYKGMKGSDLSNSLDSLLSQLDDFDIRQVTTVGELQWGRWLQSYFDSRDIEKYTKITIDKPQTSLQVLNSIYQNLEVEPVCLTSKNNAPKAVYLDPYEGGEISQKFLEMINTVECKLIPKWLKIICRSSDIPFFKNLGLNSFLIDSGEAEVHLAFDPLLCFDPDSIYVQTSRSYKVAVYSRLAVSAMFFSGDMQIQSTAGIDFIELLNIINYWRADRLQELSFQWLNMGISIQVVEQSQNRLGLRDLMSYSTDLNNCHLILEIYNQWNGAIQSREFRLILQDLRRANQQNSYSISFSLKFLILIVERMIISLKSGERLFHRLGSDYHRILVAETIFEKIHDQKFLSDSTQCLQQFVLFLDFLIRVDNENDQFVLAGSHKETA